MGAGIRCEALACTSLFLFTHPMPLHLLAASFSLRAYHDAHCGVLFLNLEGQLTLDEAQAIQVQIVQIAQHRCYAQVLINACNLDFPNIDSLRLLAPLLTSGLTLLGVHQLAWVCQSSASQLAAAHLLLAHLPLTASLFNDVEHAATWLRRRSILGPQHGRTLLATLAFGSPSLSAGAS